MFSLCFVLNVYLSALYSDLSVIDIQKIKMRNASFLSNSSFVLLNVKNHLESLGLYSFR